MSLSISIDGATGHDVVCADERADGEGRLLFNARGPWEALILLAGLVCSATLA